MKIIIIDSGVSKIYKSNNIIGGIYIKGVESNYTIEEDYDDIIGHGTAIVDVILKYSPETELYIIKIYDDIIGAEVGKLCFALEYIYNSAELMQFDIIQISAGIRENNIRLKTLVNKLCNNNKLIVSAFDNEGAMSYPAAFHNVLGVDVVDNYNHIETFDLVEGDVIDIRGASVFYRVAWTNNKGLIVSGTSFYTSYISALISNSSIPIVNKENAYEYLKNYAHTVIRSIKILDYNRIQAEFVESIKKAIVLPFNKEVHTIAAYYNLLDFEISKYYDFKYKFLIGRKINDILGYSDNENIVENIDNINWESDFDTVICGHLGEISRILKNRNYMEEIYHNCLKYNKKLYCFDNIMRFADRTIFGKQYYFPFIDYNYIPQNRFGKLRSPSKPMIGVFGTSSSQGKFTMQLILKEALKGRGYKVGNIGSEPSCPLFEFDFTYTFGYHSTDLVNSTDMIRILNEQIYNIEDKDIDLIIAGSQSGTIPYDIQKIEMLPIKQYSFLVGCNPDSVILCINNYDNFEYISRTIKHIESSIESKVICLVVCGNNKKINKLEDVEIHDLDSIWEYFKLPIFDLYNIDSNSLCEVIEKFYITEGNL